MGHMKKHLTQKEIDRLVTAQADNPDSWEAPIFVNRKRTFTLVAEADSKAVGLRKSSVASKSRLSGERRGSRKIAKR